MTNEEESKQGEIEKIVIEIPKKIKIIGNDSYACKCGWDHQRASYGEARLDERGIAEIKLDCGGKDQINYCVIFDNNSRKPRIFFEGERYHQVFE